MNDGVEKEEEEEVDNDEGIAQLVSYSNDEPLVSYIRMMRRKKRERRNIRVFKRERKRKERIVGDGWYTREEETGLRK